MSTPLQTPPDSSKSSEATERRCRVCRQNFPPEHERHFLAVGTEFCTWHARGRVLGIYLTSPEARAWLLDWEIRFRQAVELADVTPIRLLEGTSRLER